jgi:branched-chain amino acid transport system permease protein
VSTQAAPPRLSLATALKEAALSAAIAFGLFSFLIGLHTDQGPTGALVFTTRFAQLATLVAVAFLGRLAFSLLRQSGAFSFDPKSLIPKRSKALAVYVPRLAMLGLFVCLVALRYAPESWLYLWLGILFFFYLMAGAAPTLLVLALAWPVIVQDNRYLLDLGILVLTYVMLGWGLNIVVGLAGLLDLGYVAFYAVGAYSYALLAQNFGLSFWICLPLAGILAAFWGILLGFPVLRLRGDYLAIVTLAFGEIIRLVLLNWQSFTGGPNGIGSIPRPSFFGLPFNDSENGFAATFGLQFSPLHRILFLFYLILALALLTNWVTLRLRRLPVGRAWEAMREDEIACRSLGINTTNTKLTAFAIGAMFGGFAGAFFATRQGFISPESFVFGESALVLAIVVLGGMGSQIGVAVAALVMLGGFELFREFEQYRMLVFGGAMVAIMIWRPRGLVATREPSLHLKDSGGAPAKQGAA